MRLVALVPLAFVTTLASCAAEERTCYPGDYLPCTCETGERGYAQCDASGDAYGACGFCGTTPGAGTSAASGAGGGALQPFLAACTESEECASGLCHLFPAKGMFCTLPCDSQEDCPAPSPGCNMMGICKAP